MNSLKNKVDSSLKSYNKNLVAWLKADKNTTTFNSIRIDGNTALYNKIKKAVGDVEVKKGAEFALKSKDTQGKIQIQRFMHNAEYGHYLEKELMTTFKIVGNKLIIG
jgi:hypothetical protein